MKKTVIAVIFWIASYSVALANPTFYFDESSYTLVDSTHSVDLFINTDSSTITAAQTIITLPSSVLTYESTLFSYYPSSEYDAGTKPNCTHSSLPPDWTLPYKTSPYIDTDNNILYIACGFPNPGYTTEGSAGDKIASITFLAEEVGTATFSFDSTNTKFYYIGSLINPGAMSGYSVAVDSLVEPTPAPGEIPEKATDSISESDLNFVEVGAINTSSTTTSSNSNPVLSVIEEDNAVPLPPIDLLQRDRLPPIGTQSLVDDQEDSESAEGEVLSVQSLRELLIPGKSDADRTVVLINFISILSFLIILAIVVWRLFSIKRLSKIKERQMSELLSSELATLESKIGLSKDDIADQALKKEISDAVQKISKKVDKSK